MADRNRHGRWVGAAYLALGLAALACSGCLAVAAGAAGGAALGYVYYRGQVSHEYVAGLADTAAATQAALADLGMPVVKEEFRDSSGSIQSRTAHNDKVHISFSTRMSKIPAQGALTWVGVRVGVFGDDAVSEAVLGQISAHLTAPAASAPPPPPPPPPPSPPIRPIPAGPVQPASAVALPPQTPPPPLAPTR
jgi:hypothetical protein